MIRCEKLLIRCEKLLKKHLEDGEAIIPIAGM